MRRLSSSARIPMGTTLWFGLYRRPVRPTGSRCDTSSQVASAPWSGSWSGRIEPIGKAEYREGHHHRGDWHSCRDTSHGSDLDAHRLPEGGLPAVRSGVPVLSELFGLLAGSGYGPWTSSRQLAHDPAGGAMPSVERRRRRSRPARRQEFSGRESASDSCVEPPGDPGR